VRGLIEGLMIDRRKLRKIIYKIAMQRGYNRGF
jgi:hypothetical protein